MFQCLKKSHPKTAIYIKVGEAYSRAGQTSRKECFNINKILQLILHNYSPRSLQNLSLCVLLKHHSKVTMKSYKVFLSSLITSFQLILECIEIVEVTKAWWQKKLASMVTEDFLRHSKTLVNKFKTSFKNSTVFLQVYIVIFLSSVAFIY